MPFDWSAFWPVVMFLPFFAWIAFSGRRNTPLTLAERRRATVIATVGIGVGILLSGIGLYRLTTPSPVAPPMPPQARVSPAPAPPVRPPARVP